MNDDSYGLRPSTRVYLAAFVYLVAGIITLAIGQTLPGILVSLMGVGCATHIAQRHGYVRSATADLVVIASFGGAMLLLAYISFKHLAG